MLPNRKSTPPPRRDAVHAEIRVPDLGMSFVALLASVRGDSLLLWTLHDLEPSMAVIVELELPDERLVLDGVVAESHVKNGLAIKVGALDDEAREKLARACPSSRPAPLRVA